MIKFQRINIAIMAIVITLILGRFILELPQIMLMNLNTYMYVIYICGLWYAFKEYKEAELIDNKIKTFILTILIFIFGIYVANVKITVFRINQPYIFFIRVIQWYTYFVTLVSPIVVFIHILMSKPESLAHRQNEIDRKKEEYKMYKSNKDVIMKEIRLDNGISVTDLNERELELHRLCQEKYTNFVAIDMTDFTAGEKGNISNLIYLLKQSLNTNNIQEANRYVKQIEAKQKLIDKRLQEQAQPIR